MLGEVAVGPGSFYQPGESSGRFSSAPVDLSLKGETVGDC